MINKMALFCFISFVNEVGSKLQETTTIWTDINSSTAAPPNPERTIGTNISNTTESITNTAGISFLASVYYFCGLQKSLGKPIVGNPRVISSIPSFITPLVHLVKFACFPSNMYVLCDLFLPNKITCYICVLLFSFGGALFKPTWWNQHAIL